MLRLHELLGQQRSTILSCFESRVSSAGILPAEARPTEILDNIPVVFDAILRSLSACAAGETPSNDEERASRLHGQHRRATAIDLQAVLREYTLLRDCILDTARSHAVTPTVDEVQCLSRCIDVAVAGAVEEYSAHRDSEVSVQRAGLEAERRRLRTAIGLLPVAVMVSDEDGRALEVNEAMRELWASQREPLVERISDSFRAWRPETQERVPLDDLPIARALKRGETRVNEELEVEAEDGTRKTILASSAPTRDENGNITGPAVVHVDISAQAEALKESKLAVKTREEILAVVAHDLKNPLNSIHIAASRLERGVDEAAAKRMGATVNRAVQRMNRLITDLLELAQLEAGHLLLKREPVDLRVLVREALENVRPLAVAKKVWLEKERLEAAPVVDCDRERIDQVLSNLLGNAVKFTPEGGSVVVRPAVDDGRVVFEVTDTGPGIPGDALPYVFKRFWQAPGPTPSGHGLGLAIARGIVEAHGGEIWARSSPGVGSSFFFSLPLTETTSSSRWAVASTRPVS